MKLKKLPSAALRYALVGGASLIIGFMSFGGMYSMLPLLPLAIVSFVWAVAYEGEIYSQNLRNAFKKIFQKDYLERHVGKQFLARLYQKQHTLFDESITPVSGESPEFFRDYGRALRDLETFRHRPLNAADRKRKSFIQRTLRDMEYWFAKQAFGAPTALQDEDEEDSAFTRYRLHMQAFLENNKQEKWRNTFQRRRKLYLATAAFSVLVAGFMGVGTTWLLMEAFSTLPFLAGISGPLLPALIIPMSVFAGVAYGLLTYNNVTDMINNKTVQHWYGKVRDAIREPSWKGATLAVLALLLTALAITLTVFTAGTWWTIAKTATPLFSSMRHIPTIVIGLFTGLSALFFNLENTSETLGMLEENLPKKGHPLQWVWNFLVKTFWEKVGQVDATFKTETWGQLFNPFRALLLISGFPLRFSSFIGHMLSMGLGDARTPGVPMAVSAPINVLGELPETHMFFTAHDHSHGHEHHHHHNHDQNPAKYRHPLPKWLKPEASHSHEGDLPSRLLKFALLPVFIVAAAWDRAFGGMDDSIKAFERHWGESSLTQWKQALSDWWDKRTDDANPEPTIACAETLSLAWRQTQVDFRLEQRKVRHLNPVMGSETAASKRAALTELQTAVRGCENVADIANAVRGFQDARVDAHRFFPSERPTGTRQFTNALPDKVLVPTCA